MMKTPRVSLVVPCYNSALFLYETLNSITSQSIADIEILCINDGSTDKTLAILKEWEKKDNRIHAFDKLNGGIESALKFAVDYIKGEFTFLIGHDDKLSHNALESAIAAFKKDEKIDAVRMDLSFEYEEDPTRNYVMQDRSVITGGDAVMKTILTYLTHTFCLWRTAIFKRIGDIDTGGMMNFDELGTIYLYSLCDKVGFCDGIYHYRKHLESVTMKASFRTIEPIVTNIHKRTFLKSKGFYEQIKFDFEFSSYVSINYSLRQYLKLIKTQPDPNEKYLGFIRNAYNSLDFNVLIAKSGFLRKIFYRFILKSFRAFYYYNSLRNQLS